SAVFLRFVGPGDDIASCAFTQSMEQRLESAFAEAQAKVLNSSTRLSVQVLGASQSRGSQATSLIYVVRNGSSSLNGTVSSNLLNQLSAELVGYFLFYPPLSIAERRCPSPVDLDRPLTDLDGPCFERHLFLDSLIVGEGVKKVSPPRRSFTCRNKHCSHPWGRNARRLDNTNILHC
uniref:SEA domain-containing protein n=1 Tax=Scleropages formosus TaxID=113540 RepID=A0A8C9QXJ8_SCLFO